MDKEQRTKDYLNELRTPKTETENNNKISKQLRTPKTETENNNKISKQLRTTNFLLLMIFFVLLLFLV